MIPWDFLLLRPEVTPGIMPVTEAAREASLGEEEVSSAWSDIIQKRRTTRYLHLGAVLVEPIELAREATSPEA